MKKILLPILVSVACCFNHSVKAQAIPDSSFSIWTHSSGPPAYDDPNAVPMTGPGWQDLNFTSSPLFGASPVSLFKDSVIFHSSKYSARLTTVALSSFTASLLGGGLPNDTIGFMFLGTINTLSGKLTSGVPFTARPTSLKFWYEYAPVGTDSAFVYSLLTKWNVSNNNHDTVAIGGFYVNTTVSSFTQYTMTYSYSPNYLSSGNPDSVELFVSSSSFQHNVAQPGSKFWLDDFTWGGLSSGNTELFATNESVNVYPNPASSSVTFSFADNDSKILNIFDVTGKKVTSMQVTNSTMVVNTQMLPAGFYIYRVEGNSGHVLQTGKLGIVK